MSFSVLKKGKKVRRGVLFSAFLLNFFVPVNIRQDTENNGHSDIPSMALSLASANRPLVDWKAELGSQNTVVKENTDLTGFR